MSVSTFPFSYLYYTKSRRKRQISGSSCTVILTNTQCVDKLLERPKIHTFLGFSGKISTGLLILLGSIQITFLVKSGAVDNSFLLRRKNKKYFFNFSVLHKT